MQYQNTLGSKKNTRPNEFKYYIVGKARNPTHPSQSKSFKRYSGDGLTTNVIYCMFWDRKLTIDIYCRHLNDDNPDYIFEVRESKPENVKAPRHENCHSCGNVLHPVDGCLDPECPMYLVE
jgi:hypothetical protein